MFRETLPKDNPAWNYDHNRSGHAAHTWQTSLWGLVGADNDYAGENKPTYKTHDAHAAHERAYKTSHIRFYHPV